MASALARDAQIRLLVAGRAVGLQSSDRRVDFVFGLAGIHRRQLGDGQRRERLEHRPARFRWENGLHVCPHAGERSNGVAVVRSAGGREFARNALGECRRSAARVDGDREIADLRRCRHVKVAAGGIARIANEDACLSRVSHDLRVDFVAIGCRNGKGGVRNVARFVGPLGRLAGVASQQRAHLRADRFGDDENREAGGGERFGFPRRNGASADDDGAPAVRAQGDWKQSPP